MGHFSIRSSRFLKEFPQVPQLLTDPDFGLQPARLLFLVDECPKPIVALSARRSRGRRPRLCRRASIAAPDHRLQNPSESQSQFRTTQIESTKNWVRSFILPYPGFPCPEPLPPAPRRHPTTGRAPGAGTHRGDAPRKPRSPHTRPSHLPQRQSYPKRVGGVYPSAAPQRREFLLTFKRLPENGCAPFDISELDGALHPLSYCLITMSTQVASATSLTESAWEAIQGAYDLQVHVAPDVIERRIDDVGLAKEFLARGLKCFVLKSHYFPTAERAEVVNRAVPGIEAFGAITLNHSIGGLNPVAVELAGRSGAKIVWMPTVDAANETAGRVDGPSTKLPFWAKIQRELAATGIAPPPLTVIDGDGTINRAARSCLELIARHDMILATGHLGRHEIFPLVRAAREMKLRKVLVTHAEFPSQNLSGQEQLELAEMGAFIEHCFTTMHTGKAPW